MREENRFVPQFREKRVVQAERLLSEDLNFPDNERASGMTTKKLCSYDTKLAVK